jgi:hypothetical protein
MNKILKLIVLVFVVVGFINAGGTKKTLPYNSNQAVARVAFPIYKGNVDTCIYRVEPNIATLTFSIWSPDSSELNNVTIKRVSTVAGGYTLAPAIATIDTLSVYASYKSTSNTGGVLRSAVTLSPYCDQIWFIVNRDTLNGTTDTTAYYGVTKTYLK